MEQSLGVAGQSLRVAVARADHRPGALVEMGVEVGQDDGALIGPGDGGDEPRGGAAGAGRAGNDGRPPAGARGEPCDLGFDQGRGTGRAIDQALLRQPVRPGGEGDFQEVEGDPPVAVVGVWRQCLERLRIDLVDDHVVD